MTTVRERIETRDPNVAHLTYVRKTSLLAEWSEGNLVPADEVDARIAEAVADATEAAWRKAVIHSNYPIQTEWERGYNAGRLDAGKAIRGEPSHTRDPAALRAEQHSASGARGGGEREGGS